MKKAPGPVQVQLSRRDAGLIDVESSSRRRRPLGAAVTQNWPLLFAVFVALLDAVALFVGYKLSGPTAINHYHLARRVISVWYVSSYIVIAGVAGLYRRPYTSSARAQLRRCVKSHGVALIGLSMLGLFFFGLERTAELLATLTLIFLPALIASRVITLAIRDALLAGGWFLDRAVLLLDEKEGRGIPAWVTQIRRVGYDIAGILRCTSAIGISADDMAAAVDRLGARCIVVPSPRYVNAAFEPIIELARARGLTVRIFSPDVQRILSSAKMDDVAGVTIEAPARHRVIAVQQGLKRIFDASVASTLLVVSAPLLALVAAAIRLETEGPSLFRQSRSASPGRREFMLYKFRSMSADSVVQRRHLSTANETSGALFKMRNDPRVTKVGRIIRKLSIDELPQLLNVIRGEMSLVGPRPLPSDDFSMAVGSEIDGCYHRRSWVKPGLTGLWQISGRSETGFVEMVMLDLYYAEHGTIFLDFYILLNTLPAVLFSRGAY